MRRVILAAAAVVALGAPILAASPAAQASTAHTAAPAFSCVTSLFYLDNVALTGNLFDRTDIDRMVMNSSATYFCANSHTASAVELNLVGTNNCLTYTGPQTGKSPLGYLRGSVTCRKLASQTWTIQPDGAMWNAYTGSSWCLDGPRAGGVPFMEGCNTNNDQGQDWIIEGT